MIILRSAAATLLRDQHTEVRSERLRERVKIATIARQAMQTQHHWCVGARPRILPDVEL